MHVKKIFTLFLGMTVWLPVAGEAASCQNDKYFKYANQLSEQKACADAVAVYESVLVRDPLCMAAKIELGFCYLHLGNYDKATLALQEVREATLLDNHTGSTNVRQVIDAQLAQIPQMRVRAASQQAEKAIVIERHKQASSPRAKLSVGIGVSDNVNGGVQFDELTFGQGDETITRKLGEKNKAHNGTWLDIEVAGQHRIPAPEGLDANAYMIATWRDAYDADSSSVDNSEFDLGTLRGMLEIKPTVDSAALEPRLVLSGGRFFLDSTEYRDDLALGGRISQEIGDRKVTLGYQFADHNYRTIDNTDGRYHRVSIAVPLIQPTGKKKLKMGIDVGHQWPESAARLGEYRETSAKLRLSFEPMPKSDLSVSYGVSKQQDGAVYNPEFFGDAKRNIEQQALNVGWSMAVDNNLGFEVNLQRRRRDSDVKLFEQNATDLTAGFYWQLQ
ncbi:tetratricopeptide repeat protein [Thiothrix lacustris]|uniref:Tetratricopeptide repeat protein n=1 Tax=Thiothrix lacustris TaxID=525917 RepID=A0ABY9MTB6_9GAMM|nr:tetratricopeptide repeat protein [Thiothrix lacustris]WML91900.1 tetratricopeptide repeat protein [Thiothrix lacustris]